MAMKISKVLIAYDGSECADAALEDLRRAGLPEKVHAVMLSVIENNLLEEPLGIARLEFLAQRAYARIRSMMPGWSVEPLVSFGSAASVIIEKADEWLSDLIIAGSHGRAGVRRAFLGSVSQRLAHEARCSVRVARCPDVEPCAPIRLIIGVDGSKGAEAAIDAVAERQWPRGAEARIVNASRKLSIEASEQILSRLAGWDDAENARINRMVESATERLRAAGLLTSVAVEEKEPKRLLLSEAESWVADCVFVGARGMGRFGRCLLGSVSSAVAARACCSVEIVR
jgi:nucleotide-binding universal stress UspA family protein